MKKLKDTLKSLLRDQIEKQDIEIQKIKEWQSKDMDEARSLFLKLETMIGSQISWSVSPNVGLEINNCHKIIEQKLTRLKFSKFCGENLGDWKYKCDKFFEFDDTPDDTKVKLASLHLNGRALQWHQNFMKNILSRRMPKWIVYM